MRTPLTQEAAELFYFQLTLSDRTLFKNTTVINVLMIYNYIYILYFSHQSTKLAYILINLHFEQL